MAYGGQIRGVSGHFLWVYHIAGSVCGFTAQRDKKSGRWSLIGKVATADPFKMRQRPLEFVIPHKGGSWRFEVTEHEICQGTVRATLSLLKE